MLGTQYSDLDKEFRQALRALRASAGLNQDQLAKKLGTTQSTISKMERGELRIDVIDFLHICDALKVKPSDFFIEVFGC